MKHRKFGVLLLAILLIATMLLGVQADTATTGTITIKDGVVGKTYHLYRLFDLNSWNTEDGKNQYAYTVNSNWAGFFAAGATGSSYITLTDGHPAWVGAESDTRIQAFAQAALAYANENGVGFQFEGTYQDDGLRFTDAPFGYYLLDSSMGTLCSVGTSSPDLTISEKNEAPKVVKQMKKEGDADYTQNNTAAIGETLYFKSTITVGSGTLKYVYHDVATNLNIDFTSIQVSEATTSDYTVRTTGLTDGCTFEIEFKDSYIRSLTKNSTITITYQAVVNGNATTLATNKAKVEYDNKPRDTWSETQTATTAFDLVKKNPSGNLLSGAIFKLYDGNGTDAKEIKLVKDGNSYRPALAGETAVDIVTDGTPVRINGLDKKVYYLEETKAPDGYNLPNGRVEVDLASQNYLAIFNEQNVYQSGGLIVENHAGTLLPSTGGMGTTVFYLVGGLLAVTALVLIISKKRMEREG